MPSVSNQHFLPLRKIKIVEDDKINIRGDRSLPTQKLVRITCLLCLIFSSLPFLSACKKDLVFRLKPQEITVVGTIDPILALPHFIALKLNYFEHNKVKVKERWIAPKELVEQWQPTATEPTLFLTDNQGASQLKSAPVLLAQLAKGDLVLVGRQQDTLFAWNHLQRQTVLIPRQNSWSAQQARVALQNQQLRPNFDYTLLDNIPDELAVNAFIYGTGNYLITNLPIALQLESQLQTQTIALIDNATGATLGAGYITSEQNLKHHEETLQAYIDAIYKAQLWLYNRSDAEVARLIAPYYRQYSIPALTEMVSRYRQLKILTQAPVIPDSLSATHNQIIKLSDSNLRPWELTINNTLARKALSRVKLDPPAKSKSAK